jgi:DNA-3-methyladenine glycosylase II
MLRRAKKWQPWRSVASWYLWRACDLAGNASPPPE